MAPRSLIVNLSFCFIFLATLSFAEGTKQLQPASTDNGFLQIFDNNTTTRPFMTYNCPEEYRLNIRVCKPGEKIYMGFRQNDRDVYFRLKDPNGNVVMGPTLVPNAGTGYISTHGRALAGPQQIVGATGYDAIVYTPLMTGDYYIEFNPRSPTNINAVKRVFTYFDITVADASNSIKLGRLWSKSWDFQCNSGTNRFVAKLYIYADDGIVTSLDFNGMQPYGFSIAANSTGLTNTGNTTFDRSSKNGNINFPQYKIFLNDPDNECFPTGSFGQITKPITLTGCVGSNFCVNISVDKPGRTDLYFELNGVPGHQNGTKDRVLSANLVAGDNCVTWDGKDGFGNPVNGGVTITTKVDYYNGLTHLPLFDVENHTKGYKVDVVRPVGPRPALFWDDSNVGGSVNNTGCTDATGCHKWSNNFGDNRTINTWWYVHSNSTTAQHFVDASITVDANASNGSTGSNDSTICANISNIQLNGQVTTASGGLWTSTGTGTFTPNATSLNAVYTPSPADIASGKVTLKLSSTGNGACPAITDDMEITFSSAPSVNAGPDQSVCGNNTNIKLNGTYNNAAGIIWSGGNGTFSPNASTPGATYLPTAQEISNGSVSLTITTTGNGVCNAESDNLQITFTPAPVVNAGTNIQACENNPVISLEGSVTVTNAGTWTSSGSGTFSNVNALDATYTLSAGDISAGTVTLTLTSSGNGNCAVVTDQVVIQIAPAPVINAGADRAVCENNPTVTLNGSISGATGVVWSGGTGTFSNTSMVNSTYTLSEAELASGTVTLTITSTGHGTCNAVSDNITITTTASPIINAGPDQFVCSNNPTISLNGLVTGATGGTWSGGSGTFLPGAGNLITSYTPSTGEIAAGLVSLIVTSTGNGSCNAVPDTMRIFITQAPTVNAGNDQTVCSNNPVITLNGSKGNGNSTTAWSGGNGTFGNATLLSTGYTPTAAEVNNKEVTLTLTANRAGCLPVSDDVKITFSPAPTVEAGNAQSVCHNNASVSLNGIVTGATGGTWSNGNGTFSPDANSLNTTYTPTLAERNSGSIKLILTTSGVGNCLPVSDSVIITITPSPTVDAGEAATVCGNNANVPIKGIITNAGGGTWTTSGSGSFIPGPNSLNGVYNPSAADVTSGSVTLTLTSTGNNNCNAVSDTKLITITPNPSAKAGGDDNICADKKSVKLNGSVTVAGGGVWSGGTGTFYPDANTLDATYTPSAAEIAAKQARLTLTSTNNGKCKPISDEKIINIDPATNVDAGSDQVLCGSVNSVSLNGHVINAGGGSWTTSGTGTFSPNANKLNASYIPSAADKAAGSVTLTLTTTGNGLCNAISDQVKISFTTIPSVEAGPAKVVCTNDFPVVLEGSGSPAVWSGGTGTFSPDNNTLNASYTPSAAEIAAGSVTLTLTTVPTGACPVVSDNVKITIQNSHTANAGNDQTLCGNVSTISLTGSGDHVTGYFWTTDGNGSFVPDANAASTSYQPTDLEKTNGAVINFILTTTGSGFCANAKDTMQVTLSPAVTVNAGPDQTLCADNRTLNLNGTVASATGGQWSVISGTGIIAAINSLATTYTITDADTASHTITLRLTSTGNGLCNAVSDDITITILPAPVINAGTDQTVCADTDGITVSGTISHAGGGFWSGNGTGSFNDESLNTTFYTFSEEDKDAGSITLTFTSTDNGICNAVEDKININITTAPTADAGTDQTHCADITEINLNGNVTVATAGTWTTSGNGTFTDANSLTTSYQPSSTDMNGGSVTLTLETTGNGTCNAVTDQVIITFTPAPTADAGTDRSVCANNPTLSLSGAITVATGGTWSGGNGTFNPTTTHLNTSYTLSSDEVTTGSVTIVLTTTGNGTCKPVSDSLVITVTAPPSVDAGSDMTICADSNAVTLSGAITVASAGFWSTSGTGAFYPNNSELNATYVPSIDDTTSGSVTLTLTSTGNGNCLAESDDMLITITPAPTVNAGPDQVVCANNADIQLNAKVTIASGGLWTTSGTGTFTPDASALNATYIPSIADKAAGSVVLTLTTTGNGDCKPASDNLKVTITPAPVINAGADKTICADAGQATLNGIVTVATGINWKTLGSGLFTPDEFAINPTYIPSDADTSAHQVTIIATTTGNGDCNAVSDTMELFITPAPIANAGPDQTVCADVIGVNLSGIIANATGGIWTSTGTGSFAPNAATLNGKYVPSPADTSAGSVNLILTTTGIGSCKPVTDTVSIIINPAPIVNAGSDVSICADFEQVVLEGTITNAGGGKWLSSGSGTFAPDANTIAASYSPSAADISAGTVTLTLVSTDAGTCNPVSDQMVISISPIPTLDAGTDQTVCADITDISLTAKITGATGGFWSTSGSGSFADEEGLSTTYKPSDDDKSATSVTLIFTTTGNGSCNFVSDNVLVTFTPAPTVDAGPDQSVCASVTDVSLNGSVTVASGIVWSSTGTGTFAPSVNDINATYIPSAADTAAHSVIIRITSTGNGMCKPVKDSLTITLNPVPVVNAGADQTVCADINGIVLDGKIAHANGGIWSTGSGTGTFLPGPTSLNATFIPSASQIANGKATLTLTSTGNGTCGEVKDVMTINITPAPTVSAGPDISACIGIDTVTLSSTVTVATGVTWSTIGGSGIFIPHANTANPQYAPSAADSLAGSVTFVVSTTGNGTCMVKRDTMIMTFAPAPPIFAGADQTVCTTNVPIVSLSGSGSSGFWTNGEGTYSPDSSSLTASYTPSVNEIAAGFVELIINTSADGSCAPGRDTIRIDIIPGPAVNAGSDTAICANGGPLQLNGTFSIASGVTWETSGSGTFSDINSATATYTPSASDITDGNVILKIISTGNGICNAVSDQMEITITPAPTVSAGSDKNVCAGTDSVAINGTVTIASGVAWSTLGSGSFYPNATSLATNYMPSPADSSAGSVKLVVTTTDHGNCTAVTDTMLLTFSTGPTANAGWDTSICKDAIALPLHGSVTSAIGGEWSGTGTGNFSPNNNSLSTAYYFTDADKASGSIKIYLTTTGNGTCSAISDSLTVTFTEIPTITTSGNQIVCEDTSAISLNAVTTIATGVTWSASGSGTFSAVNSNNTLYTPSSNDIAAGAVNIIVTSTGNGTCNAVTENLTITITPKPSINAGLDQIVCADAGTVDLKGAVTIATGAYWSIVSGSGSFAANNSLATTYALSNADTSSKSVVLVLTSTGNGSCKPVSDTMNISIIPAPTIDAGADQPVCADTSAIALSGKFTVAGGVEWTTSGSGIFTPSANNASTAYIPSSADTTAGTVKLYLATVANGTCLAVKDSLTITINPAPVVNAGSDDIICTNENSVPLTGNIYNATGGTWITSGTGTFSPDANTLNAQYIPSTSDHANGGVILSLVSTGNGMCKQVTDVMNVTIYPAPLADVNAGFDQTLCADVATIQLNGSVKNATGGIWTSNGSGTLSDATDLKAIYTLTDADKSSGKILYVLTTVGNGFCNAVSDTMEATITPAPTANAGKDTTVCADIASISISGNITVATGGEWTSSGTGIFAPDHTSLTTTYTPSATEKLLGTTYLTLTTTGNGTCNPVSSSMKVIYTKAPTANAGTDIIECADATSVNLNGKITIATGGVWTTTGKGTFSPDEFALNAAYTPSPADTLTKVISFTLTTTGNGTCNGVKDQIKLTFTPAPTVNAGSDRIICADAGGVSLAGKITVASGAIWNTSGNGTFSPSATALNAQYIPSSEDKNSGTATLALTTTGNGLCDAVSDTMSLTIKPQPVVTVASSSPCVYTDGVALTGTVLNASGIKWTTSGSGTFSPNNSVPNPTYYPSAADIASTTVTITATSTGNGTCNPVNNSLTLQVTPLPVANAGKDQFVCIGTTTNLVGKIIPEATYQWSTNGSIISDSVNANILANSDTSFVLKVTDDRGCFSFDTVSIYSFNPPVFSMNEEFCFADTLILNSMLSNLPPYPGDYLWYYNNSVVSGENKPVIGVANPGNFVVVYAVGSCANSDTSEVHALPVIDAGADKIVCIGNNVALNANASGTPSFNYTWINNSTTLGSNNPSNIIALADTTIYSVTVTDGNGCEEKDSLIVYGIPAPEIALNDTSVCDGDEIILSAHPVNYTNQNNLNPAFSWEKDGQVLAGTSDTLRVNSAGSYTSIITIGECVNSYEAIVSYNTLPTSDMPDLIKFCPDEKVGITLQAVSGDGYKYYWHETGDSSQTTLATTSGMHYVTIINKNNCSTTDSTEVFGVCPPKVFIPNIFVPGKTGPDESLTVFGKYFTNFKMTVFNRWGEIIFYSEDRNNTWDGTYLGDIVPVGEYTWIVTYEGITEEFRGPYKQEGSVTVVK